MVNRRYGTLTALVGLIVAGGVVTGAVVFGAGTAPVGDANQASFNNRAPAAQLHDRGGPYVISNAAAQSAVNAARAHGEAAPIVTSNVLEAYGNARAAIGDGANNLSVGDDRKVYLVIMTGSFTLTRHPPGVPNGKASRVYAVVDASTGDVLSFGVLS